MPDQPDQTQLPKPAQRQDLSGLVTEILINRYNRLLTEQQQILLEIKTCSTTGQSPAQLTFCEHLDNLMDALDTVESRLASVSRRLPQEQQP